MGARQGINPFLIVLLACLVFGRASAQDKVLYKDPTKPVALRVSDLLKRMTLDEKIGQMTQIDRTVANASNIEAYKLGENCLSLSLSGH